MMLSTLLKATHPKVMSLSRKSVEYKSPFTTGLLDKSDVYARPAAQRWSGILPFLAPGLRGRAFNFDGGGGGGVKQIPWL